MVDKLVIDCGGDPTADDDGHLITPEVEVREELFTADERKQRDNDKTEAAKTFADAEKEAEDRDDARESAHTKLKGLGLTDAEIEALRDG